MSRSEVFVDSSIFVGLHLGDQKAKELVKKAIDEGYTLVTNPVVTCKERGIELILTFDSDFKRIPFLKTL